MTTSATAVSKLLQVEPLGGGRFRVTGGAQEHVVVDHPHGTVCDCVSFRYRRTCRHVAAVRRHQEAPR